jgi:hypothetical protein
VKISSLPSLNQNSDSNSAVIQIQKEPVYTWLFFRIDISFHES